MVQDFIFSSKGASDRYYRINPSQSLSSHLSNKVITRWENLWSKTVCWNTAIPWWAKHREAIFPLSGNSGKCIKEEDMWMEWHRFVIPDVDPWDSLEIFVSFDKRVPGIKWGWWITCHPHWAIVDLLPASVLDQISSVQNLGMFQRTVSSRHPSPKAAWTMLHGTTLLCQKSVSSRICTLRCPWGTTFGSCKTTLWLQAKLTCPLVKQKANMWL